MAERATVVIADDEPFARGLLRQLILEYSDFAVVGECRDGQVALSMLRSLRPDIAFLDVRMPRLDGLEVLERLDGAIPATVLVTAFDQFAVRAYEAEVIDYLVKPFTDHRFQRTIERVRRALAARRSPHRTRIIASVGAKTFAIPVDSIAWIEARGYYARLYVGRQTYLVRRSLSALESELDPRQFVRCHRGAIVGFARVTALARASRRETHLLLDTGARIPVSQRRRHAVERWLGGSSVFAD